MISHNKEMLLLLLMMLVLQCEAQSGIMSSHEPLEFGNITAARELCSTRGRSLPDHKENLIGRMRSLGLSSAWLSVQLQDRRNWRTADGTGVGGTVPLRASNDLTCGVLRKGARESYAVNCFENGNGCLCTLSDCNTCVGPRCHKITNAGGITCVLEESSVGSWFQAASYCRNKGGSLFSDVTHMKQLVTSLTTGEVWIGIASTWWASRSPDGKDALTLEDPWLYPVTFDSSLDCVVMRVTATKAGWSPVSCKSIHPVVCGKNVVIKPENETSDTQQGNYVTFLYIGLTVGVLVMFAVTLVTVVRLICRKHFRNATDQSRSSSRVPPSRADLGMQDDYGEYGDYENNPTTTMHPHSATLTYHGRHANHEDYHRNAASCSSLRGAGQPGHFEPRSEMYGEFSSSSGDEDSNFECTYSSRYRIN